MADDKTYSDKQSVADRELRKFMSDSSGNVAVNTIANIVGAIEGSFAPSGLKNAGKITTVTIGDSVWTPIPATPLTDRNAMSIQNLSNVNVKINYDNSVSGYNGIEIKSGFERYYDIKDTIILYAKSESGSVQLVIEELS